MKKQKSLFSKIFPLLLVLFLLNLALFLFMFTNFRGEISGYSVLGTISETYSNLPQTSKILFLSVWGLFFFIFIGFFIRDRILYKRESESVIFETGHGKFETDLDVLYDVLKTRQKIKIKTISKAFDIPLDHAMEWAKILESGKLASIEYPGLFGDPELVLK